MQVIHAIDELKTYLSLPRSKGKRIAFVPTMGNLHAGHLRLVAEAKANADVTVVSIFVNQMQFSDGDDFERYPRTLVDDCNKLKKSGVDVLFSPTAPEIYPRLPEYTSRVMVPKITEILCGAHRPGHFTGVTTVVTKLFNIVQPNVAFFGEKDYQQLRVIKTMVADLNIPVKVEGIATVREDDGLAMSSRNQYLSQTERITAAKLYQILQSVKLAVERGDKGFANLEKKACDSLAEVGFRPEYVSVLVDDTLEPAIDNTQRLRVFAAAWLGKARLIDNVLISDY